MTEKIYRISFYREGLKFRRTWKPKINDFDREDFVEYAKYDLGYVKYSSIGDEKVKVVINSKTYIMMFI